jgi:glycerol-3-phosphate acyltransferase PlsX
MVERPRIAIDAMGGDVGPAAIVAGCARARRKDPKICFDLYGDEDAIRAELAKTGGLGDSLIIHHTDQQITSTEKPSQAIRRAKGTSMGMAINAVKQGQAHAALSSGNTGALMAIAKLALRTMSGIDLVRAAADDGS